MSEKEMWKSVNFALTMAFMGDLLRDDEKRSERDIKLLGVKTELRARVSSLLASRSEEKIPENLGKAEALSRMLILSMICMVVKKAESGSAEGEELFTYLDESLDLGMGQDALKALHSDEEERRDAILKSMKSLILMGLKSENMTDVLHLFKALAGLSRLAEEALREREELKELKTGTVAAELGELALDAGEMARAEIEKIDK